MDKHTKTLLKRICKDMTGLDLLFRDRLGPLSSSALSLRGFWFFKEFCIVLNATEIELALAELLSRGYNVEYALIQVLLHEICHYRFYKRSGLSLTKYVKLQKEIGRNEPEERVCDRYARLYYKQVLRRYGYDC